MNVQLDDSLREDAARLFREQRQRIYVRTDRLFAALMVLQWVGGIVASFFLSPFTWAGTQSEPHAHVMAAIFLGGAIAAYPIYRALFAPGQLLTRHVIAISQVLFGSLFIHLSGGRIETHFYIFGSLAFIAFYRDWTVLIPPTVVVAADHFLRGALWPESVFGVTAASPWRWVEHAAWVLFEDVFLIISCQHSVRDMWNQAWRQAELERRNTEYRERSVQLEEAYRSKNAIVETALDAVISMDDEGTIIGWNSQAERTFGWKVEEALGRDLSSTIIPSAFRQQHLNGLARFRRTHRPTINGRIEVTALHRDGHEFPIELAIAPIQDGATTNFCAFVRDITERKHVAEALLSAKEAAEAANRAKSTFLANMSHEIRTPLNGILGFSNLLRRMGTDATEEERTDYLNTIDRSGRHLLSVINDVLDLSKIESGQMDVARARCAPETIIAEAVSILRVRAQEKGIELRNRWVGRIPETICTDPSRFRQLLINLIGNAIKFTEKGSVEVVAQIENAADETMLAVAVTDTGIGIAPEHLQSIFEPFVQADLSITRRFGGTGLGLTISRQLAERLGGSLVVRSEVGRGSTFEVTVATGSLDGVRFLDAPTQEQTPTPQFDQAATRLTGASILVVEDGETNRKLISVLLRRAGAEVTLAENGKVGVEEALARRFDLILMDMQMPVMDGYLATRALRAEGIVVPIIALTANAMNGDEERCLAAGCSGFVPKPMDADRLLTDVSKAIENFRLSRRANEKPADSPHRHETGTVDSHAPASFGGTGEEMFSSLPMDDADFVEIVREFVARLQVRRVEMRQAAQIGDFAAVLELAHWLKGSGGTAGFPVLTVAASVLEEKARTTTFTDVVIAIDRIDDLAVRIRVPDAAEAAVTH